MKIVVIAVSLTVGLLGAIALDRARKDGPIDNSGRTSIVLETENGDWCELRGPGRFDVLEAYTYIIE